MIKTKDTFCSIAWNHQFIGPDGNIKPCCRYSMPPTLRKPNIKTEKSLQEQERRKRLHGSDYAC